VELRESNSRLSAELAAEQENFSALRSRFEGTETRLETHQRQANSLAFQVAQLEKSLESERNASQDKLALLLDAKTALTDQFIALANEILEEKSKRFTEQNQSNLGALLDPLKLKNHRVSVQDRAQLRQGRPRPPRVRGTGAPVDGTQSTFERRRKEPHSGASTRHQL
jgi:DNA anti-recombination protein RmuC